MNPLHIVCPHCNAVNRIPSARINEHPVCGRCKKALFVGYPVELNDANFARHISQTEIPIVVDFWAAWCGPCKAMAPVFSNAAAKLEPRVRLAKLNTDQARDIAVKFGIRSIPTLIIFKAGNEVARCSGALSASDLISWISDHT